MYIDNDLKLLMVYDSECDQIYASDALVQECKKISASGNEVAFIYDCMGCHLLNADVGECTLLYKVPKQFNERGLLSDEQSLYGLKTSAFQQEESLSVKPYESLVKANNMPYVCLNVPIKSQGNYSQLCWAASTAAIGQYLSGGSYSAHDISVYLYTYYPSMASHPLITAQTAYYNVSGTFSDCQTVLTYLFSCNYTVASNSTAPVAIGMYNNLSAGYPIFAGCTADGTGYQHMSVIRGLDAINATVYIMDPYNGFYCTGTKPSGSSQYKYYNSYLGHNYTITGYCSHH